MCGIAGALNFKPDFTILQDSLKHRGPDANGCFIFGNLSLLHMRLSIQDIQNGSQPFFYPFYGENKDYVIIFNGEIYNHLELREEYLKDFTFYTKSDTETLLYLYIKNGRDMFENIDGMFAFAIFDRKLKKLFLARDRAGKKPLYYYYDSVKFIFASELNALKSIISLQKDEDKILSYLKLGFFFDESTPYKLVKKLRAGTFLEVETDTLKIDEGRYFNIVNFYRMDKFNLSLDDSLALVDELIDKSVRNRMLSSDLEVGCFLSGGIDSSLVTSYASKYTSKLKTFTVRFEGEYDESPLAALTASKYGTNHTLIDISVDLKNDIEKILLNYGMPFMDSSAVPSFYVSREAKKFVTVVLNGDGADELFAGYRRYVPIKNNFINFAKFFSLFTKIFPPPDNKMSYYNYIYRLLKLSSKSGLDLYTSITNDIFDDFYNFESNESLAAINEFIHTILSDRRMSQLSKFLYLDFSIILFSDLLIKMDIATMANSLEGRSPFLSKYILENTPRINDNFKINRFQTKFILRKLGERYLPAEITKQPKRGFEVPLKKWVNQDLQDIIKDSLSYGCYSENFINRKFIDDILVKKVRISEEKRSKILWTLFCLEIWNKNL